MKASELVFLLLVCGAVAALCLHAWLVEGQPARVILPAAGIAGALVLFSALRAWRTLRLAPGNGEAALQQGYWEELRSSFRRMLWCLAALPLILLFGYPLGLTLFAAVFARSQGAGWRLCLLAGGCAFAMAWLLWWLLLGAAPELLPAWVP